MTLESYFQTTTYQMLTKIPVDIRRRAKNSRTFLYALVNINGWRTVVTFKKTVPIAITSTIVSAMNPLAVHDRWCQRAVNRSVAFLRDPCYWLDVPSYVYPAK